MVLVDSSIALSLQCGGRFIGVLSRHAKLGLGDDKLPFYVLESLQLLGIFLLELAEFFLGLRELLLQDGKITGFMRLALFGLGDARLALIERGLLAGEVALPVGELGVHRFESREGIADPRFELRMLAAERFDRVESQGGEANGW